MPHIHFLHDLTPTERATLDRLLAPDIRLTTGEEETGAATVDLLIGANPTPAWLASPTLRAVIVPWAGVPEKTVAALREYPHLALHNLHYNAQQTAEMAVALLFAAAKFIVPYDQSLRRADWTPRYEPARAFLLHGKTALILGYGSIGQAIGRMLKGIGMTVIGTVRSGALQRPFADEIHPQSALPTLLPRADFLLIALPLTDETRGLIGAPELALLPDAAVLINIGRGPIVDEHALYDALTSGKLAAAGLDVWWNYPKDEPSRTHTLPANVPLHELENVVLSPHRGGQVRERDESWATALADMINMFARGEEMPNRVNLEIGY
ncbi:MAG: hydroxyacid dehydrogenase [Anaerolineales bacterium]|nr:hydroxyacid dehydrogenase [Anaerolineales bacterium]